MEHLRQRRCLSRNSKSHLPKPAFRYALHARYQAQNYACAVRERVPGSLCVMECHAMQVGYQNQLTEMHIYII